MLWNYFPQTKYAKVRPGNCARDWLTTSSSRATSGLVGRAKGADRQPARERFSIPGSAFEVNPTPRGETCLRLYRAASAGPWPDRPLRPGECLSERVNSWQGRELPGASLWGYSVETRCWSRVADRCCVFKQPSVGGASPRWTESLVRSSHDAEDICTTPVWTTIPGSLHVKSFLFLEYIG